MQGELGFEADLDGEGRLRPRRLALVNLHAPAADVARLAGLKDLYKFKVDGKLEVLDGVLDLSGGGFTGSIRLNGFGVDHAINQVSTLDMNILKVKDVQAVAEVKRAGPRWSVAGRIESADAYVLLLKVVGAAFPMNFAASLEDAGADGARPVRLDLNWQGGFVKLDGVLETSERGALRLKGHAETSMLDRLAFNFDVTVDPENRRVGPLQVTARGVNLAQVIERLPASLRPAGWTLAGQAPELKLSVEPFVLGSVWDLAEGKFPLKGRLSGTLKDGSVRHAGTASEAERIEGAFEATFARESASPSYLFGGFARLDGYEALLFRDVYVPPPEPGQQSVCQWGLRVLRDADGSMDVRVDRAALDLAGLLAFEAHGRVRVPAEGAAPAGGEGLLKAKLNVPDLAKAQAKLGRPNLRFRFPDLAEMRVSGGLSYEGTHVWSAESGALSGRARFRRAAFELGGARALKVRDLDGELPLCFYRGLWPGDWAREQRATLTVSGIALEPARVPQAPLAIVATPNELRVVNAVPVEVPGGRALVSDARAADLLGREPRLEAGVEVERIDLDALAQAEGWRVKGLQNAVLAGNLGRVTLVRRAEPVASWLLAADGELRAPFFLGQLKVGGLYARGLFGNSPVWGLKRVALEGFSLRNLTKSNPQLGRVKTVATVALTDLSAVGLRLEDIVSFTLDIDSVPRDGADDEYDGRFAYVVAPEMVERTAKSKGMTVDGIADMNFGFSKLGMRFVLAGGKLAGPQGKVAGGLIIKGAGLFSPDIAGRPGLAMDWQECVRYLRERAAKLQTLPPPPEGD
ncbi:MAG: hypothetical protein M5U26_28920 [Planctomycetota bacterium]|nr:hypothetical protein [Planctomycetota bacterium]